MDKVNEIDEGKEQDEDKKIDEYFIAIDPLEIQGDIIKNPSLLFSNRDESLIAYFVFYIVLALQAFCCSKWILHIYEEFSIIVMSINIILIPLIIFLSSFYFNMAINCIFNLFIPSGWITQNSKYYSYKKEKIVRHQLPHITIQIPVYKESFSKVIKPTIDSVLEACYKYKKDHSGTSNIFINDDGLMLLDEKDQKERILYYKSKKEITYIARPSENRVGRFKKASNMNFCIRELIKVKKISERDNISHFTVLEKCAQDNGYMAGTTENLIIGKYILILDSDSRINNGAFIYLINEIESDKNLGFIQCITEPMKVLHNYWEDCISHFTHHIYNIAFAYSCSNGNISPFVGHNALLRWKSVKRSSWIEDGKQYYWAENKVSEDFDMSLRMQVNGYTGRYVGYDLGFKEGVSLTVLEEINRFCKYSYGVNEIFLNPISKWLKIGLLSSNIKRYMMSDKVSLYNKFNTVSYMGSYYACAIGPLISIIHYFAYTYNEYWRNTTSNSVYIMLGCVILYSALLPISNIVVRIKLRKSKDETVLRIIYDELVTTLFLTIFFSGLGYHILRSILNHLFGLNMSWSTTQKDPQMVIRSFWREEVFSTFKNLKYMYIICILIISMVTVFWYLLKITDIYATLPIYQVFISHALMPLLLNPKITGL